MKKTIYLGLICLLPLAMYSVKSPSNLKVAAENISQKIKSSMRESLVFKPEASHTEEVELIAADEMEKDYLHLEEKEIQNLIEENNKYIADNHLIELANSGALSDSDKTKLTQAMRKYSVLNKVLLDRALDEAETGSL